VFQRTRCLYIQGEVNSAGKEDIDMGRGPLQEGRTSGNKSLFPRGGPLSFFQDLVKRPP
jgi:hypothetical protein